MQTQKTILCHGLNQAMPERVRIGAMRDLVKAAKQFANSSHQRITANRNPASQGIEVHLRSVVQIVSSVTTDEETIAAAWLHDLVEDTSVTLDDLEREFGRSVAETVSELSVVTRNRRQNPAARLEALKRHFATISSRAKTIKLADLLDTCRDLHRNDPGAFRHTSPKPMHCCQSFPKALRVFSSDSSVTSKSTPGLPPRTRLPQSRRNPGISSSQSLPCRSGSLPAASPPRTSPIRCVRSTSTVLLKGFFTT